jgi:hypothetical protein
VQPVWGAAYQSAATGVKQRQRPDERRLSYATRPAFAPGYFFAQTVEKRRPMTAFVACTIDVASDRGHITAGLTKGMIARAEADELSQQSRYGFCDQFSLRCVGAAQSRKLASAFGRLLPSFWHRR